MSRAAKFFLVLVLIGTSIPAAVCSGISESTIRTTEDWPVCIDPGVGNKFSDSIAIVNLYDSLVFPLPDGSVRPQLAVKWTVSPDGKTYTFTLRKGAKFHNGDPVTADDVEFSLQRLMKMGEGYAYLFTSIVKDTKVINPTTIQINLNKSFGPFLQSLVRLYILDKKVVLAHIEKGGQYGSLGDYGKKWLLTNDAGSGPYKVKELKMEEYLIGEKFDGFWQGWEADAPRTFKLSGATQPVTVRTAMNRRELEITDELQPLENYEMMKKMKGVEVAVLLNGHNLNLMLHTKKAPTDDVHFRRALAYCIDYDAVTTQIYPGSRVAQGPVPFSVPGHDATIKPFARDMEKAREELRQSKYFANLDQYPVEMTWCAEAAEEEKIALLFQANASELGIKVNITKKPFGSMIADAAKMETTPNASLVFVSPQYAEAGAMLTTRYSSSSCGTWEQMEWLQDKQIDALIEDSLTTLDKKARFAKYAAIQKKIADLCPTVWLFDQAEWRAYQAAYIDWPAAKRAKAGEISCPIMGYDEYFHDMKVYPAKHAELVK